MPAVPPLLRAVQTRDLPGLRAALARKREAVSARVMVAAAGLAWQSGLATLVKAGGDLNGSYRNYRSLHQAASRGNVNIWDALVAAGGDDARRDALGRTPRDVARGQLVARLAGKVVRTIRSRS